MKTEYEKRIDLRLLAARRIRRIRTEKGLSQEALAGIAGLHRTYISSVERAEKNFTVDILERIAEALSVDVREFFVPEEEEPPHRRRREKIS